MSIKEEDDKKIIKHIERMYTTLVQNRICKWNKQFYCFLCKSKIDNLLDSINHVIHSTEHNQRNKMCKIRYDRLEKLEVDEEKSTELVFNGIVIISLPELFCNICLDTIPSLTLTTEHIKGYNHIESKRLRNDPFYSNNPMMIVATLNPYFFNNSSTSNKTENSTNCKKGNIEQTDNSDSFPSTSNSTITNNNKTEQTENIDKSTSNSNITNDNKTEQTENSDILPSTSNSNITNNNKTEQTENCDNLPSTSNINITSNNKTEKTENSDILLSTSNSNITNNNKSEQTEDSDILPSTSNSNITNKKSEQTKNIDSLPSTSNSNVTNKKSEQTKNIDSLPSTSNSNITNKKSEQTKNIDSFPSTSNSNLTNKKSEKTKNIDIFPSTSYGNLTNNRHVKNCSEKNKIEEICEFKPITMYACDICKIQLPMNYIVKYHKMFHISDQNYLSSNLDVIKFNFNNSDEKYIYCSICDHLSSNEIELQDHLQDVNHKNSMLVLKRNYNLKIDGNPLLNLNIEESQAQSNISTTVKEILFYCQLCKVSLPYSENGDSYKSHTKGTTHVQNLQKLTRKQKDFTLESISDYLPIYKCFLCDIEFNEEMELHLHYNTDLHLYLMAAVGVILQEKSIIFISDENDNGLLCRLCKTKAYDLGSMVNHINGAEHQKDNQIPTLITKGEPLDTSINDSCTVSNAVSLLEIEQDKTQIEKIKKQESNIFYSCPICNVKEKEELLIVQHLKSSSHCENTLNSSHLGNFVFLCPICNISFDNDEQLLKHLPSMSHIIEKCSMAPQSADNINSNSNAINQNIDKYNLTSDSEDSDKVSVNTWQAESVNTENLDAILHDLVNFEPTKATKDLYTLDLLENNLSISSKELAKIGKEYISFCIEMGNDNIFLPKSDKLEKLELSIKLTFPITSGRVCIPCAREISVDSKLFDQHMFSENHLQMLKKLEDRHKIIKKCVKDQLTDFDLVQTYMKEVSIKSDYYVKCFACDVRVEHFETEKHMKSYNHEKNIQLWIESANDMFTARKIVFCDTWYYAENFICDLCSLKFYSEVTFVDHLIKKEHLYRVKTAQLDNNQLEYNVCTYCLTFWFGKADRYLTHCEGDYHKYLLQTGSHTISQLSEGVKNILKNYEETVEELLKSCENSDKSIQENLIQSIQEIARFRYPHAEAFLYGSRMSLTNLCDSDLDVYVDCVNSYSSRMSAESSSEFLENIRECFERYEDTWRIEDDISQAKVPIIKLKHRKTNIICDISCINGLVVEKSKLIRFYVQAYLPCQKLILFLKKWMHLCRLSGAQGLNSFSTSCLVIFYLQSRNILPSVHNLIELENNSNVVAGWETGFLKQIPFPMLSKEAQQFLSITDDESNEILCRSTKELIIGFFSFYSNFNYITDVISPFLGKIIKKKYFASISELPKEMNNYKILYEKEEAQMFRFDSPMCVQDPIDLSKNITKVVTKLKLRKFKQYCKESLLLLNSN